MKTMKINLRGNKYKEYQHTFKLGSLMDLSIWIQNATPKISCKIQEYLKTKIIMLHWVKQKLQKLWWRFGLLTFVSWW